MHVTEPGQSAPVDPGWAERPTSSTDDRAWVVYDSGPGNDGEFANAIAQGRQAGYAQLG